MNGVIMYKSVYGSTRQYAEWLQENLLFDIYPFEERSDIDWPRYDTIVIGSPVLMNKPFLSKWTVDNWSQLQHARVVLYSCSGALPESPALAAGYESAVPVEIREAITWHPLHGRYDYHRLSLMHKLMMNIGVVIQRDRIVKEQMRHDLRRVVDGVQRSAISPILEAVR